MLLEYLFHRYSLRIAYILKLKKIVVEAHIFYISFHIILNYVLLIGLV